MKLPIENGKVGETTSLPTVQDYLKEICKEDNVDVDQYLVNHTVKTLDNSLPSRYRSIRSIQQDALLSPKMTYTFWDRLGSIWIALKNIKYSSYNPFDFKSYRECGYWRNDGHYPEKSSTPWQRFRRFIIHQKSEIKWAWNYTPEHIKHYNKNKERVDYFEEHNTDYFCGDFKHSNDAKITLENFGYTVKPNYVYRDPVVNRDNPIL